ncbi:MAG: respiratory nitrate reductase subunit gamma [Eggerthellaceae bacterium]|nr:respiratory nitrate reductase subunit gamma [Eggerthellaceae bacterium]
MASVASIFALLAVIGFLILSAAKFAKYSKFNQHSRFDLYPVPKEGNGRGEYGGSYMEEDLWWEKPRSINHVAELVDMGKEMFFIRKLFMNQPSLWVPSMLFHGGIYFMMLFSVLLLIAAFVASPVLETITTVVGVIGFCCALLGCLLLLIRRLTDASLAAYTTPIEYFNLILIAAVLITGIISWLSAANVFEVARSIVTFNFAELPGIVVLHLILLGIMMLYIPASKMGHYAGKFFTFHSVLWNNEPNLPGNAVNSAVKASNAAGATVKWSAPHASPAPAPAPEPIAEEA